jgi:hypothetical protein
MDISETTAPRSDQQNFDDYAAGPKTVTVSEVKAGSAEQPVEIHLVEFPGRPYKPAKSMRRVLVAAWGADSGVYVGRQLTLYGDPTIRFGKDEVGGIRISHLSHIDKPLTIALTVTRGKRSPFTVEPLTPPKDESGRDWLVELADADGDADLIGALGTAAKAAGAAEPVLAVIRKAYNDAKGNK